MKQHIFISSINKIRTKITIFTLILMVILKTTVYAADTQVEAKINGTVKNGNSLDIVFNVKDVSRLYAGSLEFTYDPSAIKVDSINGGGLIKTDKPKIMEFGGETAKNGNTANYYFTCVGKVDGFTGSGSYVSIKATVIDSDKFILYKKNIKIQLVERTTSNEMKDINYTIVGDAKDGTTSDNSNENKDSSSKGQEGNGSVGIGKSTPNGSTDKKDTEKRSEDKGFISNLITDIKNFFSGSDDKKSEDKGKEDSNNKSDESKKANDSSKNTDSNTTSGSETKNNTTSSSETKNNVTNQSQQIGNANTPNSNKASGKENKVEGPYSNKNNTNKYIVVSVVMVALVGATGVFLFFKRKK